MSALQAVNGCPGGSSEHESVCRVLKYYVSPNEMSGVRVGGALEALACANENLLVEQVERGEEADFIWLNTPSKELKEACKGVKHYNHVAGARLALEHKGRMADLQKRMGERTLRSR